MIDVARIVDNAFAADSGLREVIISAGIQDLRGGIFMWCENLKEVTLPEGLTRLPYNTFKGCTSLERVTLPSTLQELDPTAFASCRSFKWFDLAEGNTTFYLEDGVLFSGVKEDEL